MALAATGCIAQVQYAKEDTVLQVVVLPRRVLKWVQSLRLSESVGRNLRRELSNGFVVAEILTSHGFKEHAQPPVVSSFENDNSLARKLNNWVRIRAMLADRDYEIPEKIVDATIHAKDGAAQCLLLHLYSMLTGIKCDVSGLEFEYSGENPATIPYYARQTTASAIKANVRDQEYVTDPNLLHRTTAVEHVIHAYQAEQKNDREKNPARYGRHVRTATGSVSKKQPSPPQTPPGTRMLKSSKFITQRLNATLSPIAVSPSPSKLAGVGPTKMTFQTTARLSESIVSVE
eukprot:m.94280 g.94280  ORF g.94280 m.94280 type:complete len:289 (+) comp26703_c0_seq2:168-1034(+)